MISADALEARLSTPAVQEAVRRLLREERLPDDYRRQLHDTVHPIVAEAAGLAASAPCPPVIGLNGAQGSGKSTLARFLAVLLEAAAGQRLVILSIDDFYLPRAERLAVADEVHPLLRTRGVPGTHDVPRLQGVIAALRDGAPEVSLPVFDKARDDRAPESEWRRWTGPADLVLLEGWCVGCPPQAPGALATPVNALEAEEDPDGAWRGFVNAQLEGPYQALFDELDRLLMLRVPSFDQVFAWRSEQEEKLRRRVQEQGRDGSHLMDAAGIRRFLSHYERLTRHMLDVLPARADLLVEVDEAHRMGGLAGSLLRRNG